jgi:hypothetical protein
MCDPIRAMSLRQARLGLGLALMLGALGCSSSATVSGKITHKGQALGGGTVAFFSPGKSSVVSQISPDGSYTIAKIPTGPVKIAVETGSAKPAAAPKGMTPPPGAANLPPDAANSPVYGGQKPSGGKYVPIPENYGDPEKSNLTYTVQSGSQTHNIDLP